MSGWRVGFAKMALFAVLEDMSAPLCQAGPLQGGRTPSSRSGVRDQFHSTYRVTTRYSRFWESAFSLGKVGFREDPPEARKGPKWPLGVGLPTPSVGIGLFPGINIGSLSGPSVG